MLAMQRHRRQSPPLPADTSRQRQRNQSAPETVPVSPSVALLRDRSQVELAIHSGGIRRPIAGQAQRRAQGQRSRWPSKKHVIRMPALPPATPKRRIAFANAHSDWLKRAAGCQTHFLEGSPRSLVVLRWGPPIRPLHAARPARMAATGSDHRRSLRAVSFNIGLRGMRRAAQHFGSAVGLLEAVGSPDVVGLQETKLSGKSDVAEEWATAVPGYCSLWACNRRKTAYSGVALYLREGLRVAGCASTFSAAARLAGPECADTFRRLCEAVPDPDWAAWAAGPSRGGFSAVKAVAESAGLAQGTELLPDADSRAVAAAEAAQSSLVGSAPAQAGDDCGATPAPHARSLLASASGAASDGSDPQATRAACATPDQLDDEGRLIVADLGFAVVINCYFPCAASDARVMYKAAFHDAVSGLCLWLAGSGREVVLMGDVNASHGVADHCAPDEWLRHTMGRAAADKALAVAAAKAAAAAAGTGRTQATALPGGVGPGGRDAFAGLSGVSTWASATARPVALPRRAMAAFEAGIFRRWITGLTGPPEPRRPPGLVGAGLERRMAAELAAATAKSSDPALSGIALPPGSAPGSALACCAATPPPSGVVAVDEPGALFVDTFRACHPWVRGAFSCWSEMTSARQTNFGSRIDYVLATRGLAGRSLAGAAVLQSVMGSDHCPVSAVFQLQAGQHGIGAAETALPTATSLAPLSADCDPDGCDPLRWHQFAARQRRLSAFFGAAPTAATAALAPDPSPVPRPDTAATARGAAAAPSRRPPKRQASLQALMGGAPKRARAAVRPASAPVAGPTQPVAAAGADALAAGRPSGGLEPAKAWQRLLKGPPKPPPCNCRPRALAVERRVLKAGENLNRVFYVCSKPAGRKEAGGRCDFFMWGSAWQAKQSSVRR